MTDMMTVIHNHLKVLPELEGVTIKPYYRPESLSRHQASLAIVPMAPARQNSFASDEPLRKEFTYQMNIEASTKEECTRIAGAVEKVFLKLGFYQLSGGLDEYFVETKRYVDARRYRGYSSIYDTEH